MDTRTAYVRSVETWTTRVTAAAGADWAAPTPCTAWTVRDLVGHVAFEDMWTAPLMRGETIEEVGDRFSGDLLQDDPVARSLFAAGRASAVVEEMLPQQGTVHLSYGEESMDEYVRQLTADHLVHAWDLAVATGGDPKLDDDLVEEVAHWFSGREQAYRSAGLIGPRTTLSGGGGQRDLLARAGRDPDWGPTHAALARFSSAFGSGDVDAIMAHMTRDCVFESTGPAPDGVRHEGADAVREVWSQLFGQTTDPEFTEEESFVSGDRGVVRWRFTWTNGDGTQGHVRGVDVMRVRDGLVSEKFSYVKG